MKFRTRAPRRYRVKSVESTTGTSAGFRVQTIVAHVTLERVPWWRRWLRR